MKVSKTTAFSLLRLLMGRLQTESTNLLNKAETQSSRIDWVLAVHEIIKRRDECAQVTVNLDLEWVIVTRCPLPLVREDLAGTGVYLIKAKTNENIVVMDLDECPKTGRRRSLRVIQNDY